MNPAQAVRGLPVPSAPLVGRGGEVARVLALLDEIRLLTLVGAGGAGKTRLGIEVAAAWAAQGRGEVAFVDLAPLTDRAAVLPAIARVLGLREAGPQPLAVTLVEYLNTQHVLLVLDNMEHLLPAAVDVAELLTHSAALRVLATSRAALQIPGEQLWVVDPLAVPDLRMLPAASELAETASVELFVARVRACEPNFTLSELNARTVAEICAHLDGLPLALELAAAQVRSFGLDELLTRVRGRFSVLESPRRVVPQRHRSLEGAMRWSVDLLDEPTTRLFRRLSVFSGGWTAHAAQAVCGDGQDVVSLLATLVEQSLVITVSAGTGIRYRMLQTLREYAGELLDAAGEVDALRARHRRWCVVFAEQVGQAFCGDETVGLDRAEIEYDNVSEALDRCHAAHDVESGLRMVSALCWFWDVRSYLGFGRDHVERLLAAPEATAVPALYAGAQHALGQLAMSQGDHQVAQAAFRESAAESERAGDLDRAAWSTSTWVISAFMTGDLEGAAERGEWAVAAAHEADETTIAAARSMFALGMVRWAQHRRSEAWSLLEESTALLPPTAAWATGRSWFFLGWFAHLEHDGPRARRLLRASAALLDGIGDRRSFIDVLDAMACLEARDGHHALVVQLLAAAARIRATTGVHRHPFLLEPCSDAARNARTALGGPAADRLASAQVPTAHLLGQQSAAEAGGPPGGVTAREFEVAGLVAEGLTNRQIGRRLGISERTAGRHVENLRGKLGVSTRAQVAAWVAGSAG